MQLYLFQACVISLYTELRNVRGVQERSYTWSTGGVHGVRKMCMEYGIDKLLHVVQAFYKL